MDGKDSKTGRFLPGNNYWQFRNKHGRDHKYTPAALWEEALEYFEWIENNPLKEEKVFHSQGLITKTNSNKMRAMTETSFCLFADIDRTTWNDYKHNSDFTHVTARISDIIRSQKFQGASADLLNPNIIARDLGLADKHEIESINQIDKVISEIIEVVSEYVPKDKIADCVARIGSVMDAQ